MGLRFRKSITLFKGVKLNLGMTGASLSFGVPGFRKTIHSSGRTTTSIGIPGTGIYYTDTESPNRKQPNRSYDRDSYKQSEGYYSTERYTAQRKEDNFAELIDPSYKNDRVENVSNNKGLTVESLKSIHKVCDDPVDWTEILVNSEPINEMYNRELWRYYHSVASDILSGDIDTYLRVVQDINPLDDLLEYGSGFDIGTDNPNKIEVEFRVRSKEVLVERNRMNKANYMELYQDYVCSCSIRVARDMFALLPIQYVVVHAVDNVNGRDYDILSVVFDKAMMNEIRFNFIDPSEVISKFQNNMNFNLENGFSEVKRIEI